MAGEESDEVSDLPTRAKWYILAVVACGTVAIGWHVSNLGSLAETRTLVVLAVATVLAALAHFASVQGSTPKSSYDLALVVYGFVLVTLGPVAAIVVSTVACVLDWAWHRPPWYIQSFNICSLALALTAAGAAHQLVSGGTRPVGVLAAVGVFAAVLVFTLLNHVFVGLAVGLATGEKRSESGILGGLTLVIDLALTAAGAAAAVVYFFNPYLSWVALIPVILISTTLRVPALERQATSDPKTGVYNARRFRDLLEVELARANRFDRPLTVVMGDLDLLRNINNVYGHLAGDEVLMRVAHILKSSVRDYDVVARFGGEEFTILMPETSLDQAVGRIEKLRATIAEDKIEIMTSVEPIRVTMSFGVAERESADDTPESIVHRADLAVYRAKSEGRNCVQTATLQGEAPTEGVAQPVACAALPGAEAVAESNAMPIATPVDPAFGPVDDKGGEPEEPTSSGHWDQSQDVPMTGGHGRHSWAANLLIAAVATSGVAVAGMTVAFGGWSSTDWLGIAIVAGMAVITEALSVDVYVRDTSVSTSAAALVAGAVLFGPMGALTVGGAIAATAMIKHRSSLGRLVFNGSTQVMAGLGCVWLVRLVGLSPQAVTAWTLLVACVCGAIVVYAISTGLVSLALSLGTEDSIGRTWARHFGWLSPYYLGLGALACCLVFGYVLAGIIGVASLLFPLLLLRFGQKQYIDHTAAMVGNLRAANEELKKRAQENSILNDELLILLSGTLDLRDPRVLGHSRYVARYAVAIGKELGLSVARLELLRKAALLHDIGKLGLPDAILAKEGPLTDLEYDQVKGHPDAGARIFDESRFLHGIMPIIRHHHERFDGHGYPSGLKGEAIPLETRILGVADAVEAMASDRSYRPGAPPDLVVHELMENIGTQFDPQVVEAFCRAVAKKDCAIVNSTDAIRGQSQKYHVVSNEVRVKGPAAVSMAD